VDAFLNLHTTHPIFALLISTSGDMSFTETNIRVKMQMQKNTAGQSSTATGRLGFTFQW